MSVELGRPTSRTSTVRKLLSGVAVAVALVVGIFFFGRVAPTEMVARGLTGAWFALVAGAAYLAWRRERALLVPLAFGYGAVVIAAGVWLGPPELTDRTVDEKVVSATGENVTISAGTFRSLAHGTEGTATVVRLPNGEHRLTLTGFATDNGPDLRVYLVPAATGDDAQDAVDIGALKGNRPGVRAPGRPRSGRLRPGLHLVPRLLRGLRRSGPSSILSRHGSVCAMDVSVEEVAPGVHHARAKHVGWVLVVDGDDVTLIDTGYPGDRDRVLESLEHIGRKPADVGAILLTHGHPDHIGSAEYLRTTHHIPVAAHELEADNVRGEKIEQVGVPKIISMSWRRDILVWSMDIARLRAATVQRVKELETFTEGGLDVAGRPVAVHTPGHTSGHTSFHLPERGVLVAGDALMTEHAVVSAPGPQLLPDYFNTDTAQALQSLERLAELPADVVVPGHGPAYRGSPADAVKAALATRL